MYYSLSVGYITAGVGASDKGREILLKKAKGASSE